MQVLLFADYRSFMFSNNTQIIGREFMSRLFAALNHYLDKLNKVKSVYATIKAVENTT